MKKKISKFKNIPIPLQRLEVPSRNLEYHLSGMNNSNLLPHAKKKYYLFIIYLHSYLKWKWPKESFLKNGSYSPFRFCSTNQSTLSFFDEEVKICRKFKFRNIHSFFFIKSFRWQNIKCWDLLRQIQRIFHSFWRDSILNRSDCSFYYTSSSLQPKNGTILCFNDFLG